MSSGASITEPYRMLDPTAETAAVTRQRVAPLDDLDTATLALVSISKERSDEFMDHIERRLDARGLRVVRFKKPTHTKPSPPSLLREVVEACDVVVQGLAD